MSSMCLVKIDLSTCQPCQASQDLMLNPCFPNNNPKTGSPIGHYPEVEICTPLDVLRRPSWPVEGEWRLSKHRTVCNENEVPIKPSYQWCN